MAPGPEGGSGLLISTAGLGQLFAALQRRGFQLVGPTLRDGALHRLPPRLIIYGIEGAEFGAGTGLSGRVEQAVGTVVKRLVSELTVAGAGGAG